VTRDSRLATRDPEPATSNQQPATRDPRPATRDPGVQSPFVSDIDVIYEKQRANRAAVAATTAGERIAKVRRILDALLARREEIHRALWDDYRKPAPEVDLSEIYPPIGEARHAIRHLRRWMRPRRVGTPLALLGSRSRIIYEPKGVVLVISPWNFPINLTIGPLISAIAAGNCVMIKPSEMTPHASAWMKGMLADLFDENEVAVIEGDADVAAELLKKRFDHIFFTGSPQVGKVVMKAAAEFLTSVTLELGGKSPVIVDRTADLDEAANKIAWGKLVNSGQVCIAPDYLLVDKSIEQPFGEKLRAAIERMSGEGMRGWIVNDRHAGRVRALIDGAVAGGARILTGGNNGHDRDMMPTVVTNVANDAPLMQHEIFGPLLPMLTYDNLDEAMRIIAAREKPLVLYVFSRDRSVVRDIMARTSAGGTVINDTLVHFYQTNLPFGGIGNSGMGKAHGFFGFEAFSNARAVLEQPTKFSMVQMLYPPYTNFRKKLIELTLRYF
jgi:aldehyde dehydrogenase (NAD+)